MTSVLSCPHCKASIASDPNLAGQVVQCPQCRQALTMPALAVVRAVPPIATAVAPPILPVESSLPVVGPSRGGSRYRKPSSGVPVWAWIVGGFGGMVLLCCGGPLLLMPSAEQMEQSTKRAKQREHERFVKEAMSSKPARTNRTESVDEEWKRGGWRSKADYESAKRLSEQYGQDIDEIRAAQELLRRQGID